MISKILIKIFVKNKSRENYGLLSSIVGIILNLLLFTVKLIIGILSNSIAVEADAFNNLTDSISSIVTLIGFKLSNVPPDKEHPFGHGRVEYISGFIVALIVAIVGIQFLKSSFMKIIHPESVKFEIIPFIILLISIVIKLWLSRFNKFIGNIINSSALKASSMDAFNDVIITSTICISLILSLFIKFQIDGYIGLLVSIFIIYSAFKLINETLSPLIGEPPSTELVNGIKNNLLSYECIVGCHDLIIHNYGHSKIIASIHAEVPSNIDIMKLHEVIDKAEKDISKNFDIILVIHMDPLNLNNEELVEIRSKLDEIISTIKEIHSIHDFRIIGGKGNKNLIFDALIYPEIKITKELEKSIRDRINNEIKKIDYNYNCIITIEKSFISI